MKIKFGALVVAGSGKIGGHVASKNRGGAYLRTKVTPVNPKTPAQNNARAILSSLSTAWSGLTESQRLGWNDAVKDFATTDVFGDIKNPSGINLFVKLNANLINSQQATLTTAPAKIEVPFSQITTAVFDVSTSSISAVHFADANLDDVQCIVSATPKVSAGTSYVKNLFRIVNSDVVDGGAIVYGVGYVAKFGNLAVGDKIFLQVQPVMPNGQTGIAQTVVCLATA